MTRRPEQLSLFEDEKDELLDLNEAEEILRQLRSENPAEYERITQLRDGIRSARDFTQKGMFVFCQMGRFQQLFLVDSQGNVISKELPRVLGAIKCGADERTSQLPQRLQCLAYEDKKPIRGRSETPTRRIGAHSFTYAWTTLRAP